MRRIVRGPTVRTAFGLYAVQGAALVIPLITLPYLTRVLTPANLGLLFFSQAFAALLTGLIAFGFELSASRDAARNQDDRRYLTALFARVLVGKAVLVVVSAGVAAVAWLTISLFADNPSYLLLGWLLGVLQGLAPLWYFLGIERIAAVASLDLAAKLVTTGGIFALVTAPDDGKVVLVLQVTTTGVAVGAAFAFAYRRVGFSIGSPVDGLRRLREGLGLALYQGATIAHQSVPALLVGVFATSVSVGYYGVADKAAKVPMAVLWPLSRALYPRVNSLLGTDPARAGVLIRRALVFFTVASTATALAFIVAAPWLIPFVLGPGYDAAVPVFRILAVAIPFGIASHVITHQVLAPLGHDRAVAAAAWTAVGTMVVLAAALAPEFGAVGMAVAVLVDSAVYVGLLLAFAASRRIRLRSLGTVVLARERGL